MNLETKTAVDSSLQKATRELQTVSRITGDEIVSVARTFEGLAGHTDTMLESRGSHRRLRRGRKCKFRSSQGAVPGF